MKAGVTEQQQGIAKGFGVGMVVVLLAYGLFYGWVDVSGPDALKERESRMISGTAVIDRVQPMTPPPAQVAEQTAQPVAPAVAHELGHQEPAPAATPTTPESPAPTAAAEHAAVTPEPAPQPVAESPAPTPAAAPQTVQEKVDEQMKDAQKYPNGMAIAPVDGLYEDAQAGRLPAIRQDGLTPFQAYRKAFPSAGNAPVISIAVMDAGLSQKITESAIKSLPPEISLIISPYADGPDMWVKEARSNGHEVWMTLPMESMTYPKDDTGPYTLMVGAPERDNLQKLDWVMSRAVGYAGLVATYNPAFMDAQNDVRPVLGALYKRGVGFMANGGVGSLPDTMALSLNAPYSSIDVWIDKPEDTPTMINASLQQLETIARDKGFAAGVISPSTVGFRELQVWIETLKAKGIVLAPLSAQTGY